MEKKGTSQVDVVPGVASSPPGTYWPRLSKLAGLFLRCLTPALQNSVEPGRHSED